MLPPVSSIKRIFDKSSDKGDTCLVVGTSPENWDSVNPFPVRSIGMHPWQLHLYSQNNHWLADMEARLQQDPALGVGEIGLDKNARAPITSQIPAFQAQMLLAAKYNRRVSIHCVRTHGHLLAVFQSMIAENDNVGLPKRIYMHAWSGSVQVTETLLRMKFPRNRPKLFFGLCVRHSKIIVFDQVVGKNQILVESDLPFDDPARKDYLIRALELLPKLSVENIWTNFKELTLPVST